MQQLHDGMHGPVIQHLDIKEEGKGDTPGIGAHLTLGRPLRVGLKSSELEAYEDLDHLIAGFADQYVNSFRSLLKHRCGLCARLLVLEGKDGCTLV